MAISGTDIYLLCEKRNSYVTNAEQTRRFQASPFHVC
jgi:hypothetical protein